MPMAAYHNKPSRFPGSLRPAACPWRYRVSLGRSATRRTHDHSAVRDFAFLGSGERDETGAFGAAVTRSTPRPGRVASEISNKVSGIAP
jgi:hypothetical protein